MKAVIFHAGCSDGILSAYLLDQLYRNISVFIGYKHGDTEREQLICTTIKKLGINTVLVADVCPSLELVDSSRKIIVWDHHSSEKKLLDELVDKGVVVHYSEVCATKAIYESQKEYLNLHDYSENLKKLVN